MSSVFLNYFIIVWLCKVRRRLFQFTMKLKRSVNPDIIAISAIIFIHCCMALFAYHLVFIWYFKIL